MEPVKEPVTEQCEESDDEDNKSRPQCSSHVDMIVMYSQMTAYFKGQTNTHKYFSYVNSLQ